MAEEREEREELRGNSDRLLAALDDIKSMEREKRTTEISSPPFHGLADAITDKSREVFRIAAAERDVGNEIEQPQGETTNDVEPRHAD